MAKEEMVTSPAGEIPDPKEDFLTFTATICSFHAASATFETSRKRKEVFREQRELQLPSPVSPCRHRTVTQLDTVWPCPCMVAHCNRQGQELAGHSSK